MKIVECASNDRRRKLYTFEYVSRTEVRVHEPEAPEGKLVAHAKDVSALEVFAGSFGAVLVVVRWSRAFPFTTENDERSASRGYCSRAPRDSNLEAARPVAKRFGMRASLSHYVSRVAVEATESPEVEGKRRPGEREGGPSGGEKGKSEKGLPAASLQGPLHGTLGHSVRFW